MALQLIPENIFLGQLEARGFEETKHRAGDLEVWTLNGDHYIIPMPVHTDENHRLYCPFAIELFFKHVFGEITSVKTNLHNNKDFNIVPISKK
jgi:hypothetical protein